MEKIFKLEPTQQISRILAIVKQFQKFADDNGFMEAVILAEKIQDLLDNTEIEAHQDIIALEARPTNENKAELMILYLMQDINTNYCDPEVKQWFMSKFDLFNIISDSETITQTYIRES